jgi:hypothetical protein
MLYSDPINPVDNPNPVLYSRRTRDNIRIVHSKFHKDWFRHSKTDRGNSQAHRQHDDLMSLLTFSK